MQHGQGIIAVNEVESGYEWLSYKELIISTVAKLMESYEETLDFINVKLQYIDALDLDQEAAKDFMSKNLQTELITKYPLPGDLKGFNIQQRFNLHDSSIMELNISSGINNKNQKESVVWTNTITKQNSMTFDQLKIWIEFAHSEASIFFKQMLNPDFYASLDR